MTSLIVCTHLHSCCLLQLCSPIGRARFGRARLSWPGSIWSAPTPVLSNRKYLTIVYKRIDLERSGHDNRARPLGTVALGDVTSRDRKRRGL